MVPFIGHMLPILEIYVPSLKIYAPLGGELFSEPLETIPREFVA